MYGGRREHLARSVNLSFYHLLHQLLNFSALPTHVIHACGTLSLSSGSSFQHFCRTLMRLIADFLADSTEFQRQ